MLRTIPVDVKTLVTVRQFESYMSPPGRPLVIRGWTENWQALSKWDFGFFKTGYGEDRLSVSYTIEGQQKSLQVAMKDYVDYITNPGASSELKQLERRLNLPRPFYCVSYKPFRDHPELLRDFTLPPFVADWWGFFNESFARSHFPQNQGWVFLGGKNVVAELHKDSHHTLTWLAQIRGRKQCYLFSPDDSESVYHGSVDPVNPEWDKYPLFRKATAHICILNPGEMLFLPPDWWHHVVALDDVITVSYNLVNHINFGYYLRKVFGERLPDLLALLPGQMPPRPLSEQEDGELEKV